MRQLSPLVAVLACLKEAARSANGGKSGPGGWTDEGIIQGGLHGGQPLFHISCLYELQPVGPGDGGFGCLAGSHLPDATIGPHKEKVSNGHFSWGRPPFAPDVDPDVTRVEGQPGDCVLFTERLVHSTLPWKGAGERRSLFIKYVPWGMHYQDVDYDMSLPGLSERELEVMEYPSQWLTEVRHKASPFFDADKEVEGVGPLGLELTESGEEMSLPAARL